MAPVILFEVAAPAGAVAVTQGLQAGQEADGNQRRDQPVLDGRRAAAIAREAPQKVVETQHPRALSNAVGRLP